VVAHPEFEAEQQYITHAYECLDNMRVSARLLQHSIDPDAGGTHQARLERDVVEEKAMGRLSKLQLGSESLIFGRIDRKGSDGPDSGERFYIGRLPVSDKQQNPVVVDWRAPVAEAFYRATGRNPLGLERRRHFATEETNLIGIDDEVFDIERLESHETGLVGTGALLAALGKARSGHMRDIVATIQSEQDEIIRGELQGILVVQGGPGTGKTAVALHRASYLLYTHRFPLERQGVLVVGPNRTFVRYIARVLPALGETGVDLAGIDDLYPDVVPSVLEKHSVAKVKGDIRMAKVVRRAVATRERGLRDGLTVGFSLVNLTVSPAETAEMVAVVKRSHRVHNQSRKHLQSLLVERLYVRYREAMARKGLTVVGEGVQPFEDVADQLKRNPEVKLALDRMWPLLTPQMLLRDLYSKAALISAASRDLLNENEQRELQRDRGESVDDVAWTSYDIPLLDEAAQLLGPLPKQGTLIGVDGVAIPNVDEGIRTYGHIVIDETQDLSPMQLRMVARRSLGGSMTIVGDIGQATGMWAPQNWDQVLSYLPAKLGRKPPRQVELTVGYRTPAEIMAVAAKVLAVAAPELTVPRSVRTVGYEPLAYAATAETLIATVVAQVNAMRDRIVQGTIGILCPDDRVEEIAQNLQAEGIVFEPIGGNGNGIAVLGVRMAKGLEFDGVIIVEPAIVAEESAQGLRALFVALTRPTQTLTIVHSLPLPACIADSFDAEGRAMEAGAGAEIVPNFVAPRVATVTREVTDTADDNTAAAAGRLF
jgi:DNA helicase IV